MVLLDTQHILDKNALTKPIAQDCLTVFNFVVALRTKFVLVEVFILQIVIFLLLWRYPLSTLVTFVLRYLNNIEHNGRHGGSDSSGPFGY